MNTKEVLVLCIELYRCRDFPVLKRKGLDFWVLNGKGFGKIVIYNGATNAVTLEKLRKDKKAYIM